MKLAPVLSVAENLYLATLSLNTTCVSALRNGLLIFPDSNGMINYSDLYLGSEDVYDAMDGYAKCFSADSKGSLGFIYNITVANVDPDIKMYAKGVYNFLELTFGPFKPLTASALPRFPLDKPHTLNDMTGFSWIPDELMGPIFTEVLTIIDYRIAATNNTSLDSGGVNSTTTNSILVKRQAGTPLEDLKNLLLRDNKVNLESLNGLDPLHKGLIGGLIGASISTTLYAALGSPDGIISSVGSLATTLLSSLVF